VPSACGIACEICILHDKEVCPGCAPGNDPKAQVFMETVRGWGMPCPVLECAINNKIDYCSRCEKFPCDVHYQGFPYSKELLDSWKKLSGK
jgi:hypothetical protein